MSVILDPTLTDERAESLFAWISRAFDGEDDYNDLMLGLASVFGTNLPRDSQPRQMLERAEKMMKDEEVLVAEMELPPRGAEPAAEAPAEAVVA